ncbi:MAG: trypsin-like peptidase domain-containing protein [Dysgonamonadaceae bacterium]|jgi:hypothetical protein|nr:trypsin-like peptidase domain-containing protein [Dysgonamonadaceae bacterium]
MISNAKRFFLKSGLFLAFYAFVLIASAQISHGGRPLSLQVDTRISAPNFFVEMPPFDAQEARLRSEQERSMTRSLEFAHKFHVFLRPDNSGITFTSGNMNVWRVGIRSKDAYSLNILFSKFRIPRGAQVFVYNADQTEILGSYTHLNNSDLNLLPIQPILGDELIVEYQEPINASFRGEIEIGEVNHDFLGVLRATEPRDPTQPCHPNIICYPDLFEPGKGVVVLIINGTTFCTGVLVNNTAEDGTPYLLTATHCLNNNYDNCFLSNRQYDVVAGRIVAFFNYESPVCNRDIRGTVQMTLASADSVLISEQHDISLLRFKDNPPKEYQPYFLGWNASSAPPAPFYGLHHPNGGIKKVAVRNGNITLGSWTDRIRPFTPICNNLPQPGYVLARNAHWIVNAWDVAATEAGSSGSPIVDRNRRVVGTLTGGSSYCPPRAQGPDYYASLSQLWNVQGSLNNPNSLSHYLDPTGSGFRQLDGFNPYANAPITRSHNFNINDEIVQTLHNSVPMFATNNTFGYSELAEEFNAEAGTKIVGVFVSSSPTANIQNMDLRIRVYTGGNSPEHLVHEQPFTYSFQHVLGNSGNNFDESSRRMTHNVENYIQFDQPVNVSGRFYVSYVDMNNVASGFSALNVARSISSTTASTAWVRKSDGWIRSLSENMANPVNTSLLIAPYVVGNVTPPPPGEEETILNAYHSRTEQMIFVESNKDIAHWEVFYSNGQQMFRENANENRRLSKPSGHWARGVYIVRIRTVGGVSVARKILVM